MRSVDRSALRAAVAVCAGAVLLAAAGCGEPGGRPAEPRPAAGLEIREPRVQLVPGGMGAVYLSVVNPGTESDRLLAVEAPAAAAEIHETVQEGSLMRMVARPEGFEIPPRGTVELAPGGKHVMLIGPRPGPGDTMRLGLRFEKAGVVEIDVPVIRMGAPNDEDEL